MDVLLPYYGSANALYKNKVILEEGFGDEYGKYKKRVRRWIWNEQAG